MAAPINEGNILVGSGKLEVNIGSGGWDALGGTEDGVEFSCAKEFHDVQGAEAPVTLRKELTQLTGTISCGLLEATLDNLLLMWPGIEDPAGTLTVGTDGTLEHDIQFRFTGKGPAGTTRVILFPKIQSVGDGAHRYSKGASTVINCEFEVMAVWNDDPLPNGKRWEFGTIIDS